MSQVIVNSVMMVKLILVSELLRCLIVVYRLFDRLNWFVISFSVLMLLIRSVMVIEVLVIVRLY